MSQSEVICITAYGEFFTGVTPCIAFTGTLQNYDYFDYFPYVTKILELTFVQTGHLILKFYIETLCFHILRRISDKTLSFCNIFFGKKKYHNPIKSKTMTCMCNNFQLSLVYLMH